MTTAYTSLLGLALPVTGELQGTWGDTVNNSITSLLDAAVAGTTTLSTDADVTLTTTTGAANQARQAIILWTAGGTATRTITVPAQSKIYTVINKTSSTQSIKIVGVGPTTGVTIPAGRAMQVAWNGSDFVDVSDSFAANGTANGVVYLNASKVPTTGTGLVFDATNTRLGIGGTPSYALDVSGSGNIIRAINPNTSASFVLSTNSGASSILVMGNESVTAGTSATGTSSYAGLLFTTGAKPLQFGTNSVIQATVDTSGNWGYGVTPSAWSSFRVLDFQYNGSIQSYSSGGIGLAYNAYFSGQWVAKSTGSSCKFSLDSSGGFSWQQLASVTSGVGFTYNTAMTLDASGNLGNGTASPAYPLDIQRTGSAQIRVKSTSTSGASLNLDSSSTSGASNQVAFLTNNVNKWALGGKDIGSASGDLFSLYNYVAAANSFTIDAGSNFYIGAISGLGANTVNGLYAQAGSYVPGGQVTQLLGQWMSTANDNNGQGGVGIKLYRVPRGGGVQTGTEIRFYTGYSYTPSTTAEVGRFDQDGNFIVNGTSSASSSAKLQVQNSNLIIYRSDGIRPLISFVGTAPTAYTWNTQLKSDASQNYYMIANPGETVGVYMSPSASGWNNLSDERFKTDWVELTGALSGVMTLRAGTFSWVKDPTLPRDVGIIAQDVLAVLPEAVNTIDPNELGVRYTHLVPLLIKAIQEQQAIIESLTQRITVLEQK